MEIFVIMGAAVRADGQPSGAMRRRVEAALCLARSSQDSFYVATGGRGRFGPPEADVMKQILVSAGVPEKRVVAERESSDTLSSVINCASIIRREKGVRSVLVCSDRYHIPRCRWLFWLLGIHTGRASVPSGREANGILRWSLYYVRELVATPVDTVILLARRLSDR
jgi:uncharacterized SAM-binding protein YcdF (DUF218 family)